MIAQTRNGIAAQMLSVLSAAAIAICPAPPQPRFTCVHDGDTIWWQGEKIRLVDIDTPELNSKDPEERARAIAARDRLVELIGSRQLVIERQGTDRYGRTLARIGTIGDQLVKEGHARRWK